MVNGLQRKQGNYSKRVYVNTELVRKAEILLDGKDSMSKAVRVALSNHIDTVLIKEMIVLFNIKVNNGQLVEAERLRQLLAKVGVGVSISSRDNNQSTGSKVQSDEERSRLMLEHNRQIAMEKRNGIRR